MQPSEVGHSSRPLFPAKRKLRCGFSICGVILGLVATAVMALDNLVLWGPPASHQYFYPITHSILGFGPFKSWVDGANSAHPLPAYLFWIVLLGGPLLEWTSWGVIIDVVRAKIAARRFGRAA
jgi:hypothetical protein